MITWSRSDAGAKCSWAGAVLLWAGLVVGVAPTLSALAPRNGAPDVAAYVRMVGSLQPTYVLSTSATHRTTAIPAFARKYGLPCSACHTVWPELNAFGQRFRDNGYQLGNDRDSPIWQSNSYWPIAVRTTPQIHVESTTKQQVDAVPGDPTTQVEKTVSTGGFDISGMDLLMLGTLYKNITFGLVPTIDADGTTGVEAAFVRFDNLGSSPWANLKVGKFELDNLLSEKRFTWLSNNGGFLYAYHFVPVSGGANFGLGDNQIGAEFSGHSFNGYTRYSVSFLTTDDGEAGLPGGKSMDAMFALSQAWALGSGLGPQRVGVFGYLGHRPTVIQTVGGNPIPGTASDNKSFLRIGATAQVWFGNLELLPLFSHASDNAALSGGTQNPAWNSALLEAHYIATTRLMVQGRYEMTRMSKQADPAIPKTLGNADAFVVGVRAYPFLFSRDGMALHGEFAMTKTIGTVPLSGDGSGVDPATPSTAVWSRSVFLGFDFAF